MTAEKRTVGIVSGTRPEIIKLAPVYHALCRQGGLAMRWVHTGVACNLFGGE